MEGNPSEFHRALSNFTGEVAYAGAVRHLYQLGYGVEQIQSMLYFPASAEQIRKVIDAYDKELNSPEAEYEFVQETDPYGRKSFRKVKKES